MTITTRFIHLFEGRTGSSLLGGILNQNPAVISIGEELAALKPGGWKKQEEWLASLYFDTQNFDDPRVKPSATAVGCKVKLRDIADPAGLRAFIESNNIKVIHLRRDNFIKQVVSSIRAMDLHQETGHYNLRANQENLKPAAYPIPPRKFNTTLLWLLDFVHRLDVFLAGLNLAPYRLSYEELQGDLEGEVNRLCAFLEVKPHPFVENLIKITSDNLAETISNYDELVRFYSDSKYGLMFK